MLFSARTDADSSPHTYVSDLLRQEAKVDLRHDADIPDAVSVNRLLSFIKRLWSESGEELDVNVFYRHRTLDALGLAISNHEDLSVSPKIIELRGGEGTAPLLLFAGGASCFLEMQQLIKEIRFPGPILGVALTAFNRDRHHPATVEDEVQSTLRALQAAGIREPYRLLGYSFGGVFALELARVLSAQRQKIAFLGMLDTPFGEQEWPLMTWGGFMWQRWRRARTRKKNLRKTDAQPRRQASAQAGGSVIGRRELLAKKLKPLSFRYADPHSAYYPELAPQWMGDYPPRYDAAARQLLRMKGLYKPSCYDGELTFYRSLQGSPVDCDPKTIWGRFLTHANWVDVAGNHQSMIVGRNAGTLARDLSARLVR
ncbi:thioesterase domain-containing protein [Rhizobium sp. CNPSo 4062]|uniref:thioesterase domain-containing protein n=1 Tax=Rhizobium sp. CNPSo 4062 TaxID=3021410 RepID=UPI002549F635|nr:thioesterase domain-containing protein [Rhizobium sp. CNPSo 4062]MDK4701813.1 thioesterase domain-containing protein [Rhizobium sp. CNPSo 4062]